MVIDPSGESYQISGALERVAPGDEGHPVRRYLEIVATERLVPGSTCPPPGGLEVSFSWRLWSSAR